MWGLGSVTLVHHFTSLIMPAGPLDRWLQRGPARQPLQPVQAEPAAIEPRDQQTASPPASLEQRQEEQEQRAPGPAAAGGKASLLAFLRPREDDADEPPPRKRRHTQR